jgi:large subunit ribosomal protein L15
MELHNLKPASGSVKRSKRIARGQGSGTGGTSTRGHKGAKSRSGYKSKKGFEGGQMPLQRRVPKRGFKNHNRIEYRTLNLNQIQEIADKHNLDAIDVTVLAEIGLIKSSDRLKVLGGGELKSKIDVSAHSFSATANEAIQAKGGSANTI